MIMIFGNSRSCHSFDFTKADECIGDLSTIRLFPFIKGNNLIVDKSPIHSSAFVKSKEWQDLELPKIMIMHTRMKTQGSEQNSNNNHPLYNKEGMALVHNGIIHNDHEIFGKNQRDGEVDS